MVSEDQFYWYLSQGAIVLILIVVEYGLGEVASNDIPNLDKKS